MNTKTKIMIYAILLCILILYGLASTPASVGIFCLLIGYPISWRFVWLLQQAKKTGRYCSAECEFDADAMGGYR